VPSSGAPLADLLAVAASVEQCLADTITALFGDYPALEAVSEDGRKPQRCRDSAATALFGQRTLLCVL